MKHALPCFLSVRDLLVNTFHISLFALERDPCDGKENKSSNGTNVIMWRSERQILSPPSLPKHKSHHELLCEPPAAHTGRPRCTAPRRAVRRGLKTKEQGSQCEMIGSKRGGLDVIYD